MSEESGVVDPKAGLVGQGFVEVAPDIWISEKRSDGKHEYRLFGQVAFRYEQQEDGEAFVRQEVLDWNNGQHDDLPHEMLDRLHEGGYFREQRDLWLSIDEESNVDVQAFGEVAEEWEKACASQSDEDWVASKMEANEERLRLVASFLELGESRELGGEKQVGPNDPCPCGKLNGAGRPVKYKKCCMWGKRG